MPVHHARFVPSPVLAGPCSAIRTAPAGGCWMCVALSECYITRRSSPVASSAATAPPHPHEPRNVSRSHPAPLDVLRCKQHCQLVDGVRVEVSVSQVVAAHKVLHKGCKRTRRSVVITSTAQCRGDLLIRMMRSHDENETKCVPKQQPKKRGGLLRIVIDRRHHHDRRQARELVLVRASRSGLFVKTISNK